MSRAQLEHYDSQRKHLEHALASPKGLRLRFTTLDDARSFRMRCYSLRKLDRYNNKQVYPPGDALHNKSIYDSLVIAVEQHKDHCDVTIKTNQPEPSEVTEL